MSSLALAAYVTGGVLAVLHLPLLLSPRLARRGIEVFPRNSPAGWLLTGLDLAWVAWIVISADLGRFEYLERWVYLAAPVSFLALVFLLDELLAPRALGGLLLLAANPVLNAARWHPSPWRLVLTVLAYAWVVLGMLFVLSPYRLRVILAPLTASETRTRALGAAGTALAAAIIVLGMTCY